MGTYVTETGPNFPDFEENKLAWEEIIKATFGDETDLDPEMPFGQFIGLAAFRDTQVFDACLEVYYSRDVDKATGVSLDILYAERGLIRIGESPTFVPNTILYGDLGTLIEAGKQAKQSAGENTNIIYSNTGDVTIALATTRDTVITVQPFTVGDSFSLTIDGTVYPYTSQGGDDETAVAAALVNLVVTGALFEGTISSTDGDISITQLNEDFSLAFTTNIVLDIIGVGTTFQADTPGPFSVPQGTLDTIVTPVNGWDSVTNPSAGTIGRKVETDAEFRIRAANTGTTSKATEQAIANDISNNVTGVSRVDIQSNRTDFVDGDGLPAHSFEVVVSGGTDLDVATSIWNTQGAGIASFGNVQVQVIDSDGNPQQVFFSRPVAQYTWVKVKRSLYSEEDFPADGDDQIKDEIVAWSLINQPIGKDIIRQRLGTPVYVVPGIEDIEITIAVTATPGGTPVYGTDNIEIPIREYADFDITRISVEAL